MYKKSIDAIFTMGKTVKVPGNRQAMHDELLRRNLITGFTAEANNPSPTDGFSEKSDSRSDKAERFCSTISPAKV